MNFLSILLFSTLSWSNPELDSILINSDVQLECQIENDLIDSLVFSGKKMIGTPYRYAGNSTKGIDCSGLVHYMFGSMGATVARNSRDLSNLGYKIDIDEVSKGDLLFFKGRNINSKTVGHVAIVVEVEGEDKIFLHASTSKGVVLEKINENGYFDKRFLFAKRIDYEEIFAIDN